MSEIDIAYSLMEERTHHQGLEWLRQHVPIYCKMESDTKLRLQSEAEYKKLIKDNT